MYVPKGFRRNIYSPPDHYAKDLAGFVNKFFTPEIERIADIIITNDGGQSIALSDEYYKQIEELAKSGDNLGIIKSFFAGWVGRLFLWNKKKNGTIFDKLLKYNRIRKEFKYNDLISDELKKKIIEEKAELINTWHNTIKGTAGKPILQRLVQESIDGKITRKGLMDGIRDEIGANDWQVDTWTHDQVNKVDHEINVNRAKSNGIATGIWIATLDNRVRKSHLAMHGKTFQFGTGGLEPSQEYGCRCSFIASFDGKGLSSKEIRSDIASIKGIS